MENLKRLSCCEWLVVLLLCSSVFGCSVPEPSALRIGIAHAPVTLDPRFATDASSERITRLLYERLVEFDQAYNVVPGIADWQRISAVHYRFTLGSQRRTFSDGQLLSAMDICATYRNILAPEQASPHAGALAVIAKMDCTKDKVDFHLRHPDVLFPGRLIVGILPAKLIVAGHSFERQPVGSGPFSFVARASEARLHLKRRSDGLPIEFHAATNPTVRVLKLVRGELDIVQGDLTPELFRWLGEGQDEGARVKLLHTIGSTMSYIGLNLEDPALAKRSVRLALALSLDRSEITEKLMVGMTRPAEAVLPPGHWALDPELPHFSPDLVKARELLADAGYSAEQPLRLLYKTSNNPLRLRLATVIQSQLARAGVEVAIASHDWGTFYADVKAGRFQMYSLSWVGLKMPDIFRYAFHSNSVPPAGANRGRYRSPEVDRLLDIAEQSISVHEQALAYYQVQRRLLVDLPHIPLWYEDQVAAVRTSVRGYTIGSDGGYDGLINVQWPRRKDKG
jgi:peptide/nickel transport system substrate-binding protein